MIVSILLDAFIVFSVILGIVIGLKQGFIKMFVLRFRKVAAAVISLFLAKPVGAVIARYFLADKLAGWIIKWGKIQDASAESADALLNDVPLLMRTLASLSGYDLNALAERAYENGQGMQTTLITDLSYPVASFIAVVLAWIGLFFLLFYTIKLLSKFIENVFELPVLKQINSICGAFIGLVFHAAVIWTLCKVLGWILTTDLLSGMPFMQSFSLESTHIAKYIYHFNPLAFILSVKPI